MKLLGAEVEWHIGYANEPELILHVDSLPEPGEFGFEQRGPLYYAEKDGCVRFYAYNGPGQGFGGREFSIRMENGEERVLKGPWSSRAGCMNRAGFGPCVDVHFVIKSNGWRTYGSVTLDVAQEAAKLAGVTLKVSKPFDGNDDIVWRIADPKPEGKPNRCPTSYPSF